MITQKNFSDMLAAFPALFFQNCTRAFWIVSIPYQPVVLSAFGLPCAVISVRLGATRQLAASVLSSLLCVFAQILASRIVWKILIQKDFPELHKMYIALEETDTLVRRKDELLGKMPHRRSALVLQFLCTGSAVLSILSFVFAVVFSVHIYSFMNSFDEATKNLVYLSTAGVVSTCAGALVLNASGVYVFLRRFNNNALIVAVRMRSACPDPESRKSTHCGGFFPPSSG
jgi:hypothetical protein